MADIDLLKPRELMPKDILQFVEQKAERAIEVLREIIDVPEYDNAQLMQAVATPFATTTNGLWGTGTGGSISGLIGGLGNQLGVNPNG